MKVRGPFVVIVSVFYLSIGTDNYHHPYGSYNNKTSEQLKKYISNIGKTSHNPFDIFNSSLGEQFSSKQIKDSSEFKAILVAVSITTQVHKLIVKLTNLFQQLFMKVFHF